MSDTTEATAPAALEPGEAIEATAQATPVGKRKQRQQQIGATIAQLAERYPQAFFVLGKHRKPLRIGIAEAIKADGAIQPKDLRWALCSYCSSPGYLRSFQVETARLDLAGNEAGRVTAADVEHARRKLDEVLAKRQPKPKPAPQQRREGPAAQERAPRKQQAANLDRGEIDSQRCKTTSFARQSGSAAGRHETGASAVQAAREQPQPEAKPSAPACSPAPQPVRRVSLADLKASAARQREAVGVA